ncbi:hypothetical protein [Streptomyces sp. NPDC102487]|uniref:hypothetical protein n=1 Tax=Streptomyces sp. NPDC102487 TaxID=3366182 RepID=UPI0038078CC5
MTKDRRRKLDARAQTNAGNRYNRARRQTAAAPGASIRTYTATVSICGACGQPAYESSEGPAHFVEQQDGIFCPAFPRAVSLLSMEWDLYSYSLSLDIVREKYPWPSIGSGPHRVACGGAGLDCIRKYAGPVFVGSCCGQPAKNGEYGPEHFTDQWDGILCPRFPLAENLIKVNWHSRSLAEWKAGYHCTYPRS